MLFASEPEEARGTRACLKRSYGIMETYGVRVPARVALQERLDCDQSFPAGSMSISTGNVIMAVAGPVIRYAWLLREQEPCPALPTCWPSLRDLPPLHSIPMPIYSDPPPHLTRANWHARQVDMP